MKDFFAQNSGLSDHQQVYGRSVVNEYVRHLMNEKTSFSYSFIDIDNYTYIVDSYGEETGERVLEEVGRKISELVAERGLVARLEGDHFILVVKESVKYEEIWEICHKILVEINKEEIAGIRGLFLTVTIGLSRFPENGNKPEVLMEAAEKALYRGKTKGRNCFIIYLPEKHANIIPKSDKGKVLSSINLHSAIFRFLDSEENLANGIQNLINFLSSYYKIHNVCIQSNGKILFEKIHQSSANKTGFAPVTYELVKKGMNQSTEMFYFNDLQGLLAAKQTELHDEVAAQKISAACFCDISFNGKSYGLLRLDMTSENGNGKIWQYADMDIFLTAAKTIAFSLHFAGKTLEELK